MKRIEVRPVSGKPERNTFLHFPWKVYRGDSLWVPPLLPEIAERSDPQRGVFFKRGEAEFFLAWRGRTPVGRICAAEDCAVNEQRGLQDCMFGFFECLPDQEAAISLFDCAADWGRSRGRKNALRTV